MKTKEDLLDYLKNNKNNLILFDTLGSQRLISYDQKKQSLYYLQWSPRENTGDPKQYINFEAAVGYIKEYKPDLLKD